MGEPEEVQRFIDADAIPAFRKRYVKAGVFSDEEMETLKTTTEAFVKRVEESLRRLQTDHVDIAMLHAVDDPAALRREEVLAAHDRISSTHLQELAAM